MFTEVVAGELEQVANEGQLLNDEADGLADARESAKTRGLCRARMQGRERKKNMSD